MHRPSLKPVQIQKMSQLNGTSLDKPLTMPFCGTEFWNSNITWYTESPYFTQCFQSTVLAYLPTAVYLMLTPVDIFTYVKSENREVPWGLRIKLRLGVNILIALSTLIELSLVVIDLMSDDPSVFESDVVGVCIRSFSFLLSIVFILISKHFGQVYSGPQFFFWLTSCLCQGLTIGSLVTEKAPTTLGNADPIEILYSCNLAFSVIMLFLNFFADDLPIYSDLMRK